MINGGTLFSTKTGNRNVVYEVQVRLMISSAYTFLYLLYYLQYLSPKQTILAIRRSKAYLEYAISNVPVKLVGHFLFPGNESGSFTHDSSDLKEVILHFGFQIAALSCIHPKRVRLCFIDQLCRGPRHAYVS